MMIKCEECNKNINDNFDYEISSKYEDFYICHDCNIEYGFVKCEKCEKIIKIGSKFKIDDYMNFTDLNEDKLYNLWSDNCYTCQKSICKKCHVGKKILNLQFCSRKCRKTGIKLIIDMNLNSYDEYNQ